MYQFRPKDTWQLLCLSALFVHCTFPFARSHYTTCCRTSKRCCCFKCSASDWEGKKTKPNQNNKKPVKKTLWVAIFQEGTAQSGMQHSDWCSFVPVALLDISDIAMGKCIPTSAGRMIKKKHPIDDAPIFFFFPLRDKKLPNPEHIFFFNQSSCCLYFTCASLELPIATCSTSQLLWTWGFQRPSWF